MANESAKVLWDGGWLAACPCLSPWPLPCAPQGPSARPYIPLNSRCCCLCVCVCVCVCVCGAWPVATPCGWARCPPRARPPMPVPPVLQSEYPLRRTRDPRCRGASPPCRHPCFCGAVPNASWPRGCGEGDRAECACHRRPLRDLASLGGLCVRVRVAWVTASGHQGGGDGAPHSRGGCGPGYAGHAVQLQVQLAVQVRQAQHGGRQALHVRGSWGGGTSLDTCSAVVRGRRSLCSPRARPTHAPPKPRPHAPSRLPLGTGLALVPSAGVSLASRRADMACSAAFFSFGDPPLMFLPCWAPTLPHPAYARSPILYGSPLCLPVPRLLAPLPSRAR